MAAKKKEYVEAVSPVSGNGVNYEIISRTVTENAHRQWPDIKVDPYDEIVEVRKKTCYGNPEETFETFETARYRKYHPIPDPVEPVEVKVEKKVVKKEKEQEVES